MLDVVDDNLENNSNNKHSKNLENSSSSVNALLPLDNERLIERDQNGNEIAEDTQESTEEIKPNIIITKHNFVSSPWTKLGIVGGFFALGFGIMFLSLNSLMGGGGQSASKDAEATPTSIPTPTSEEKDGDAYAKLALQKQENDLQNLNGKEETTKEEDKLTTDKNKNKNNTTTSTKSTTTKTNTITTTNDNNKVATQETRQAPVRGTVAKSQSSGGSDTPSKTKRSTVTRVLSERPSRPEKATIPKITREQRDRSNIASAPSENNSSSDPLADIERLRNLSSMGRIEYNKQTNNTNIASSNAEDYDSGVSSEALESRRRRNNDDTSTNDSSSNNSESQDENNDDEIQQLTPRWQPSTNKTVELSTAKSKQVDLLKVNYLQEESQILEERAPQYLVVGSSTKATLVTPLMIAGDKPNKNLRFVAQLNEPIKSNTGAIAIPTGTQVAITVNGVDGGFGMNAEVVGILKDGTEYPITPGTITVLAAFGNPLIARPYKGKGGEIAGYDMTLGSIAGLAKVGEIINQQDETTEDLPLGGTRTRTSGGNRNVTGAFLEGAFGALATSVGKRTQTATTEVTSRPNVWYVPGNTKITLRVNRSIKL